jgi:hypothetical protein
MFVGHYGPSFAATSLNKSIPLWVLFLAVQFLDILWGTFVLLGIEKVRIVPGITATSPLDLYYMPYTHGLDTAILWALLVTVLYRVVRRDSGWAAAALVGAAVFSHWVLDLLVHRPDMPLYDDTFKVGLGLWNYPVVASGLEVLSLFGGLYLYFRATKPVTPGGRYGMVVFGVVMLIMQGIAFFGPPPASDRRVASEALAFYFILAGVAYWLERMRV